MPEIEHRPGALLCPFLPEVTEPLRAAVMKTRGKERGGQFYYLALQCAHSLWLQGFPAQSLLLINRAFGADHTSRPEMWRRYPPPYAAAAWVMQNREEQHFIGNPRRHYQHLATRMVAPRKELRRWRAWACWYMARRIFPGYPADDEQIANEGIVEPTREKIVIQLRELGLEGEDQVWESVIVKL